MTSNGQTPDPAEPTQPLPASGSYASGPEPTLPMPQLPPQGTDGPGLYPPPPPAYPGAPQPYPGPPQAYPGAPQAYPGAPQAYPGAPQPYPGAPQPYPGAPQPYPGPPQAYPGAPQGYPGGPPQPPYGAAPGGQRKSRVPLIIGVGVGVLVLGLVAVFTLLQPGGRTIPSRPPATSGGATAATTAPPAAEAFIAVQSYLEALAAGDAATALSYAATPPTDTSLLTVGVLSASLAEAPISGITTTPGTGEDHQTVQASYRLGDTAVSTTYEVTNVSGTWLLDAVAAPLPLDLSAVQGLPLTVNGVPLGSAEPVVFPGRYTVRTTDEWYKFSGASVVVQDPASNGSTTSVTVKLSGSGVSAIRKAAQSKLDACIKKKSLSPKGCGFSTWLPGKNKVRPATVNWDVTGGANAMRKLKPTLFSPESATASVSVKTRVYCYSTNGLRWRGFSSIHTVYATLADGKVSITFGI